MHSLKSFLKRKLLKVRTLKKKKKNTSFDFFKFLIGIFYELNFYNNHTSIKSLKFQRKIAEERINRIFFISYKEKM